MFNHILHIFAKGYFYNTGIAEPAAAWLIKERGIIGTGLDAMSMDPGDVSSSKDFKAHRTLLGNKVWIIENVGDKLAQLPPRGFYVLAMPYKLKGGSGAPTRLVAVLGYEGESPAGANAIKVNSILLSIVSVFLLATKF